MNQKPTFTSQTMEPVRTVLVTGFEPFGDHATNISEQIVERLSANCPSQDLGMGGRSP